jgi:hypothetical protein
MMDIINPWGALRNAKIIMGRQADLVGDLYEELDAANERIANIKALVAEGHFRNPKTGRIGPKGKTFQ